MGLGVLILMGTLAADDGVTYVADRQIDIRFKLTPPHRVSRLILFTSQAGSRWQQAAVALPRDGKFTFAVPADGRYQYTIVTVEGDGRREPADLTQAQVMGEVVSDTTRPKVTLTRADRDGGDVAVAWSVDEANFDPSGFRMEYRARSGNWRDAAVRAAASGTTRFPADGEVTVRLTVIDRGGLRGEATRRVKAAPVRLVSDSRPAADAGGVRVPENFGPRDPEPVPPPAAPRPHISHRPRPAVKTTTNRTLPPPEMVGVTNFKLGYSVRNMGPSGLSRVELWVTRDDGEHWEVWANDEDRESPVVVDLAARGGENLEGVYGFRVVAVSGAGLGKRPPRPGDKPDKRVLVDVTGPTVQTYDPVPHQTRRDTLILRWKADDPHLADRPITIEWSPRPEGGWRPVTASGSDPVGPPTRLENTGSFAWRLPANMPTHQVYLRYTAIDRAGNTTQKVTDRPVEIDMHEPEASIQGIVGAGPVRR